MMEEIKTDLFPGNLRAGKKRERGASVSIPGKAHHPGTRTGMLRIPTQSGFLILPTLPGKHTLNKWNIPAWMMKHFPATGLYSVEISSSVASAIVRRQRRRS